MLLDVSWGSVILTIFSRCWRRLHGFVVYVKVISRTVIMASTTGATLFKLPTQPFSATRSFPTTKANPSISSSLVAILGKRAPGSLPPCLKAMEPVVFNFEDRGVFKLIDLEVTTLTEASTFVGASLPMSSTNKNRTVKMSSKVTAAAAVATTPIQEITEYVLPSWAMFELGKAPVYWKTMNGLPPTSGQKLKLFYNQAATKLNPNEEFDIAFNGTKPGEYGQNQTLENRGL